MAFKPDRRGYYPAKTAHPVRKTTLPDNRAHHESP